MIENGMVVGAQAEIDRREAEAEARCLRVIDALVYIRTEKVERRKAIDEVLDAIECAPSQLLNYLKECILEDDLQDLLATIDDIYSHHLDTMAQDEVDGRR